MWHLLSWEKDGERERERMSVRMNGFTLQIPSLFSWKLLPASPHCSQTNDGFWFVFWASLSVLGSPVPARQLFFLLKSSSPLSWHIWNRPSLHRHSSGTCSIPASLCSSRSELLWSHSLLRASTSIAAGKFVTLVNWAGREVMLLGKK